MYSILESVGIEIPRYAVLDRDSADPKRMYNECIDPGLFIIFRSLIKLCLFPKWAEHELVESEDHVEVNGIIFNKPFVEVNNIPLTV